MEYWDVYDVHRRPLGKLHLRGKPMPHGEYHLIVFVWVVNSAGQLLLTKRSPEKEHYPNLWEETGIPAAEDEVDCLITKVGRTWIADTYLLRRDVPLEDIRLQPGETCDAQWVTRAQFDALIARNAVAKPDVERFALVEQQLRGLFW